MMDKGYQATTIESASFFNENDSVVHVENREFLNDVFEGLNKSQKTLPCKYFYDKSGSEYFEKICELDEYYITRTELALLEEIKNELAERIGTNAVIIEPGACLIFILLL